MQQATRTPSPLDVNPHDTNEIVVSGYPVDTDDENERNKELERFFANYLKQKVKVVHVSKIKYDLFRVTVSRYIEKLAILMSRTKLRHERPFINVYSEKADRDRKIRGLLRRIAQEEKAKGNTVVEKYRKIIVSGNAWKWSDKYKTVIKVIMTRQCNRWLSCDQSVLS